MHARRIVMLVVVVLGVVLAGAAGAARAGSAGAAASPAEAIALSGAGATFPAPLYREWARAYRRLSGTAITYGAVGSGSGIARIRAGSVDFGASDMPLSPDRLDEDGLVQFPMVMGGVVPVVNLAGVKPATLRLDGRLLAGIYLGAIVRWNDPRIARLNPGLMLPDRAIVAVHRSDSSGTTFLFTHYLSSVDADFKDRIGANTALDFPTGIGAEGNAGVARRVQRIPGSIGYVGYAYAVRSKLATALLRNRAGVFVAPDAASFQEAVTNAGWATAPDYDRVPTDEPGRGSWPVTDATFILVRREQGRPAAARAMLRFFDWAYHAGTPLAAALDYLPMPPDVVARIERDWRAITGPDGRPVWKGPAS